VETGREERLGAVALQTVMSVHRKCLGGIVIVLGIILLVLGFVFGIHILWIIGIVALVIGAILAIAGFAGREVGGRRHWY
jgi:uncharacterized membrane protein HdeD (DUF308 family)